MSGPAFVAETIEIVATGEDEFAPRATETMPAPELWQPWPEAAGVDATSLAPPAGDSAEWEPQPEPIADVRGEPEPELAALATAETEQGIPYASEAERVLEEAAAEAPVTHPAEYGSEPLPSPSPSPVHEEGIVFYAGEAERVIEEAAATPLVTHQAGHDSEPPRSPSPSPVHEEGIDSYTGEAERVIEEAVAETPAAHPGAHSVEPLPTAPSPPIEDDVRAVTEKPANPRRGWWQRLTQS